jgi:hypothetical protein
MSIGTCLPWVPFAFITDMLTGAQPCAPVNGTHIFYINCMIPLKYTQIVGNMHVIQLSLVLCIIGIATTQGLVPQDGFYNVMTSQPAQLTATCGTTAPSAISCGCVSPMSATSFITDGSAAGALYTRYARCWWKILGTNPYLIFTRFQTAPYGDFVKVNPCTTEACTVFAAGGKSYDGVSNYGNGFPLLNTQIQFSTKFLYVTWDAYESTQGTGFNASFGTNAIDSVTTATPCEVGTYCINGVKAPCPAGTFANVTGSSACTACSAGTYSTTVGAYSKSTCQDCATGTYSDAIGASSRDTCTSCAAGTYSTAPASTTCTPCAAGTFSTAVGASSSITCLDCQYGRYSDPGATSSSACAPLSDTPAPPATTTPVVTQTPGPTCPEHSEQVLPDMKCACIPGFTGQETGPCDRCSNCIATLEFTVVLSIERESFTSAVSDTYRMGVAQTLQVTLQSVAIVLMPPEYGQSRRLLTTTVAVQTSVTIPRARGISVSESIRGLATSTYLTNFGVDSISSIKMTISDTPTTPTTSTDIFDEQTLKTITLGAGITAAVIAFVCILMCCLKKPHNHTGRPAYNSPMLNGGQNPYQRTHSSNPRR